MMRLIQALGLSVFVVFSMLAVISWSVAVDQTNPPCSEYGYKHTPACIR